MQKLLIPICISLLIGSCIDRLDIKIPAAASQLVVNGLITDEPGPYTVKLSVASSVDDFLKFAKAVTARQVTIFDNMGNSEILKEIETGTFQTKPNGIQGVIGREYSIRIETQDGKIYESIPDKLNPVGDIDSLYYEFKSFEPLNDQTQYGYRFFVDGHGLATGENLVRWRFESIFEVETDPKIKLVPCPNGAPCSCEAPTPCSGFIVGRFGLEKVGDCTCCTCWVTRHESKPQVADDQFIAEGVIKKVEVGYIPLEYFPFLSGKYRVEQKK